MRRVPPSERGAALLAVLVLVAVMGGIAAGALERLRLSTALATNGAALDQARAYALAVEDLLALRVDDLANESPSITNLDGDWNGTTRRIPLPGEGEADGTVRDGGNCFNLRQAGVDQFVGLMQALGIAEPAARRVAEAAADWIDSDEVPSPAGAEDAVYASGEGRYRTGNTLFADASELRAVVGVTGELYGRLKPHLCALPVAELSRLNVNTLLPWQAPLLAMLAPGAASPDRLRALLASRPARGWQAPQDFWRSAEVAGIAASADPMSQLQLKSSWFTIDLTIRFQGSELEEWALLDTRLGRARVLARRWGPGE